MQNLTLEKIYRNRVGEIIMVEDAMVVVGSKEWENVKDRKVYGYQDTDTQRYFSHKEEIGFVDCNRKRKK